MVQATLLGLPDGAIDGSDEGMEVEDADGFELGSAKGLLDWMTAAKWELPMAQKMD